MAIDPAFAEKHRNTLFSNNVTATLRQQPGRFMATCGSRASYTGSSKARIENRFGRVVMNDINTRNADSNMSDMDSLVRFIKPGKRNAVHVLLDAVDVQESMVAFGAPIVNEIAQAAATYEDDRFFAGFFGNGYSGEAGDTAETFKSANIVAHGSLGLTKDKLIALRELMRLRNAPFGLEMPIIGLHPGDESDLLGITEYVNSDYTDGRPLMTGEIKPWMGFRFMPINPDSTSLPQTYSNFFTDSGTTRVLPVWFPRGMHAGTWEEFTGKIGERADKNHGTQFSGYSRKAAVRTDEDLAYAIYTK